MKKIFNYIVLAVITILVLYLSLKDNYEEIIHTLSTMDMKWIIIAFIVMIIAWTLKTIPIYYFTKSQKKSFKYRNSVMLVLRTQFVNAITPFATGGQPYQIYYLNKNGIRSGTATGIILQNFIVYQIALVTLGLVALVSNYIFHFFPYNSILIHLITLGFIINTLVIIVSFVVSFAKNFNKKLIKIGITFLTKFHLVKDKQKTLDKWNERIIKFHDSASILVKNKKLFISMILVNFLYLSLLYIIPMFVMFAMGDFNSVGVFTSIISSAYVMLIGSFVPIPGGTGGLEYGYIKFYGNFISGGILSASMLIWRFITYYFGLIIGAIAFNIKESEK